MEITHWIFFISTVCLLIGFDLGVLHRKPKPISFLESIYLSLFYIFIALGFGVWIGYIKGVESFAQYMTAYLVEKSLSLDNVFLIALIFTNLSIPTKYQHRVLFWGILSAIIFRGIMIALGIQLISRFEWILYIFAVLMIISGLKIFLIPSGHVDLNENKFLKFLRSHLRITEKINNEHFFVYQTNPTSSKKELYITPLFLALILVEVTDIMFVVDSIPAVFAITQDPFIIYTSNIFAILGLRALYFALSSIIEVCYYLKYSLAVILIFIGGKIIYSSIYHVKIPALLSLSVTSGLLLLGVLASFVYPRKSVKKE
ncbi:MAG: TerC/Alx family metal homeostasis membrane protein [Gammaproteobacteria bacterium]|nr:TerC/Alx family metal homeostasis membrane protein [Gammaproteobacteria bacterium]